MVPHCGKTSNLYSMQTLEKFPPWKTPLSCVLQLAPIVLITLICSGTMKAAVVVDTIGGGPKVTIGSNPYGNVNGNTFTQAKFNGPYGIALDSLGNLYIADKTNNAIRKITLVGNT